MSISYNQEYILLLNALIVRLFPRSFIYKKDLANLQLCPENIWLPNVCNYMLNCILQ